MVNIYKEALKRKLTYNSSKGVVNTEQLFSLNKTTLKNMIIEAHAEKSKGINSDELSFLQGEVAPDSDASLRFEILSDVYRTKMEEDRSEIEKRERKEKLQKIEAIRNKVSENQLEKMISEMSDEEYKAYKESLK